MHEYNDSPCLFQQSLQKACSYPEAMKVSCQIENAEYQGKVSCVYSVRVALFPSPFHRMKCGNDAIMCVHVSFTGIMYMNLCMYSDCCSVIKLFFCI